MKKSKSIWNYIDLISQIILIGIIIIGVYYITESMERYFYRYTVFPFIAVILIFLLGILVGRGAEKTKHNKPIGLISKKMYQIRKKQNIFVFSDEGETYVSDKEIVEEIRSGEIVHIKQFQNSSVSKDDFDEIYKIRIDDVVDKKMEEISENENDKEN